MPIPARPARRSLDCTTNGYGTRANSGMSGLGATGLEWEGRIHDWSSAADVQRIVNDSVAFVSINSAGNAISLGIQGGSQVNISLAGYGTDLFFRLQFDNSDPTSTNRRFIAELWAADGSKYEVFASTTTLPATWTFTGNTRIGQLHFGTDLQRYNGHVAFARCKEGLSPQRQRPIDGAVSGSYIYAYDFEADSGADGSGNSRNLTMTGAVWGNSPALPAIAVEAAPTVLAYPNETRKVRCVVDWPDAYTVSHQWSIVSGSATLTNDTTETVNVVSSASGSVVLRDTVTISDGVSSDVLTADVTLTVMDYGTAVPLMLLGSSITVGNLSTSGAGWRGYLKPLVGSDIDFVGGEATGTVQDGDNQHEGHGGFTSLSLADAFPGYIAATPAHAILVMAGTNDLTGATAENGAARACGLIEDIVRQYPSAKLYWSHIPFRTDSSADRVDPANVRIEQYAARLVTRGFDVETINVNTELISGDIADDIHPNDSGYEKIASAIFAAGIDGPPEMPLPPFEDPTDVLVTVNLGGQNTGLATVGYTVTYYDGTPAASWTVADATEIESGVYAIQVPLPVDFVGWVHFRPSQGSPLVIAHFVDRTVVTGLTSDQSAALVYLAGMIGADVSIDKATDPTCYQIVYKIAGTDTEIARKELRDIDGAKINSDAKIPRQLLEV